VVSYACEVLLTPSGFPKLLLVITISFLWFEENRGSHYFNFLLCCKHFNKQLTQTFFPYMMDAVIVFRRGLGSSESNHALLM